METAPRPPDVTAREAGGSGVDAYFAVLRKEQARFLDAIAEARSLLDGSRRFARATAIHAQLTRRFLDAQRAILKRRAEVEAEMALGAIDTDFEVHQSDGTEAARQLAALLDTWWHAENQTGRKMLDAARGRADECESVADTKRIHACNAVGVVRLSSEMVAALDAADPADLASLLTTLDDLLEPPQAEEVRHEGRPVDDDVIIWLAPVPIGLQPIGTSWSR
jgi:hypothetical protein